MSLQESLNGKTQNISATDKGAPHAEIEDTAPAPHDQGVTFPEGGLRAWSIVLGSFLISTASFGYPNTFGIFEAYYSTHQLVNESSSAIAWIGSIQLFFLFFGGIASGPLFDIYGARAVLIPASVVFVFTVMMTSLCTEYYQFLLAQGVLGGIAIGFLTTPAISVLGQYFQKRRATAMGIAVSGSSIGGVVWPIALNRLLHNSNLGFAWTVRVIGFIFLGVLTVACILVKERLPPRKGAFFIPSAFTQLSYVFTTAGLFMTVWGLYTPFYYIVTYSLQHGMSTNLAYYTVAILNSASFFGRVIPGILADKFGVFNIVILVAISTSILEFCWIATSSNAGIIVFAAVYGFCSGAVISLFGTCTAIVTPLPSQIGTYMGMAMSISGIAGLTGTPITGALIGHYGGYTQAAVFSGVVVITGAVLLVLAKIWHEKKDLKKIEVNSV